jgi:diadenosine tetraphosphatase ApaH/serine/threonine PP2A family protein phosphatase
LYNNLEAISEENLSILCNFFVALMRTVGLAHPELASGLDMITANLNSHDPFEHLEGEMKETIISLVRRGLKKMKVVLVAPITYYQLKPENLYEYELPPGLITINEAMVVIEVYRRGGKLVTSSVHKLLRLGYKHLQQRPNVCDVTITDSERLIVVGDIHGQLTDLLHILDLNGMPGINGTKYIFNGDFVDRGDFGVECMLILLALLVSRPDCVYMNRGNHEDFAICSVYGFQAECCEKYDPITFSLFVEIFQQLPFYCVINKDVFVVHGGLFQGSDVTLEDLNALDRSNFALDESATNADDFDPVSRSNYQEFLKQMGRDSLWSDPMNIAGKHPSMRGAGIAFGEDVAREFLTQNNMKFIIRSHECIRSGYDEPYASSASQDDPLLCTIFSASDYGGSGNSAAYIEMRARRSKRPQQQSDNSSTLDATDGIQVEITTGEERSASPLPMLLRHPSITSAAENALLQVDNGDNTSEVKSISNTSLYYTVHYFFATPLKFDELALQFTNSTTIHNLHKVPDCADSSSLVASPSFASIVDHPEGPTNSTAANSSTMSNYQSSLLIGWGKTLEELICDRKQFLYEAFTHADRDGHGHIHLQDWLKVMSDSFNISISWKKFSCYLISPKARDYCELKQLEAIDPLKFLDSFHDDISRKLLGTNDDEIVTGMDELHSFIDSFHISSNNAMSANESQVHATAPLDIPQVEDVSNHNTSTENLNNNNNKLYHGHEIGEEVIEAIYSNRRFLETAFFFFDTNKDGLFTIHGFQRGIETLKLDLDAISPGLTVEKVLEILDIYECGEVDMNVFFEMYRLCCLNRLYQEDTLSKPLLRRETTVSAQVHRLSVSESSAAKLVSSHVQSGHHPVQNSLASVEIKRGKELAVDAELATRTNVAGNESAGLSIDI